MKKRQFLILIGVILLCAGGIFGYIKYREDNQELYYDRNLKNDNNQNETQNTIDKYKEDESKINELINKDLTDIEKKYNIKRNLSLELDKDGNITGLVLNYKINNVSIEPSFIIANKTNSFNISLKQVKEYVENKKYDEFTKLDYKSYLNLNELSNNYGEKYLVVGAGYDDTKFYVYYTDDNVVKVGTVDYLYGCSIKGGCYDSSGDYILDEIDKSQNGDNPNYHFRNNYIVTVSYDDYSKNYYLNKFTIEGKGQNAKLKREVIKTVTSDGIYNCNCK